METFVIAKNKVLKEAFKEVENIPKHLDKQLEYFLHDWFRMVIDEERAKLDGDESPSEMFERFMKPIRGEE